MVDIEDCRETIFHACMPFKIICCYTVHRYTLYSKSHLWMDVIIQHGTKCGFRYEIS